MPRRGLRFQPPSDASAPEAAWVLRRAFGPTDGAAITPGLVATATDRPHDPQRALDTARRLSLAPRIGARAGRARLAAELGAEPAAAFIADRTLAGARALKLEETRSQVAAAAAAAGIPIALLKFAALDLAGVVPAGGRPAGDVDVLAPAAQAAALHASLLQRGWYSDAARDYEQHLPALMGRSGIVEIHRVVLGIQVGRGTGIGRGAGSADFERLRAAGLLESTDRLPGQVLLPTRDVLIAHALVHGLAQHGFAPRAYPLATMLADLCDLGFAGAQGVATAARIAPWLTRSLPSAEIAAAQTLVTRLAAGEDPFRADGDGGDVLLRHILAGVFDTFYAESLKLRQFAHPLSDRSRLRAMLGQLGDAMSTAGEPEKSVDGAASGRGRPGSARPLYLLRAAARSLLGSARRRG